MALAKTRSRNILGTIGDSDAIAIGKPTFFVIHASLRVRGGIFATLTIFRHISLILFRNLNILTRLARKWLLLTLDTDFASKSMSKHTKSSKM